MFWIWLGFIALVLGLLALDLGVFHRKVHVIRVREALGWSAFWISLGLLYSVFIYFAYEGHWLGLGLTPDAVDGAVNDGGSAALKYLTGYVVEKSLSVDNIFVIALVFTFFGVPALYQHRVLFWGILGALIMRGTMIGAGTALISTFHWILYVFGGFLVITGLKMLFEKEEVQDPHHNRVVKLVRRFFPVTARFHGEHFFVRAGSAQSHESELPGTEALADPVVDAAKAGTILLTPLALTLVIVETTDLIFAVDSIPAIFAITADPFIVFTSNVFAILGLRSLYFALAGMLNTFRYLKAALALILMLVGAKMLVADWLKSFMGEHFNFYLLAGVLGILTIGIGASIVANRRDVRAERLQRGED